MTTECYSQAYSAGFDRTVRFLRSRGVRGETARELAQAAWVRGCERIGQLRDENIVLTWVNTIALNIYRAALRKARELALSPEMLDRKKFDFSTIDVERILNVSCPKDRDLFERYLQGATTQEIAEEHGVTQTAIRLRLLRARREVCVRLRLAA